MDDVQKFIKENIISDDDKTQEIPLDLLFQNYNRFFQDSGMGDNNLKQKSLNQFRDEFKHYFEYKKQKFLGIKLK